MGVIITWYESVIDQSIWKGFRCCLGLIFRLIDDKSSHYNEYNKSVQADTGTVTM